MNKGLKALETLKLLKDFVLKNNKNGLDRRLIIGSCDILEKELKDYYALKKECEEAKWYQEHKALKIIKEKIKFEIIKAIPFNNYTEYYVVVNDKEIVFDQEEYDLLKETLL